MWEETGKLKEAAKLKALMEVEEYDSVSELVECLTTLSPKNHGKMSPQEWREQEIQCACVRNYAYLKN